MSCCVLLDFIFIFFVSQEKNEVQNVYAVHNKKLNTTAEHSYVHDEFIAVGVKAIIDHTVTDLRFKDALYGPISYYAEASVRECTSTVFTAAGITTYKKN